MQSTTMKIYSQSKDVMRGLRVSSLLLFLGIVVSFSASSSQTYYRFVPITVNFEGPETSELGPINPFLDYRLDVTFIHLNDNGTHTYTVPGYYAADGDAAETSAVSGNIWQVKFAPEFVGEWDYSVSFLQGNKVAIDKNVASIPIENIDGLKGAFTVVESKDSAYARGRLEYVGKHYLQFSGSKEYFLKTGVDSPENLLAYDDIDATPNVRDRRKTWEAHKQDYKQGGEHLLWQGRKGEEIFGAIDYLHAQGLNSFSFLTFNVDGDDRNVFPHLLKSDVDSYVESAKKNHFKKSWETHFYKTRLDVSKLAQWERIFTYGSEKGFFLHFKTQEEETDHLMDNASLGVEQKLYYRELIARFAHHPSLNWNLGEENDIPRELQKEIAAYIREVSPYKKQHIVLHTYPPEEPLYADLVGEQSALTGASIQAERPDFIDVYSRVSRWYLASEKAGKPWAVAIDEPGSGSWALKTDGEDLFYDEARVRVIWGSFMAGGWGVEWYFGYRSPQNDLDANDYRSRANFWPYNAIAREFFEKHVPFYNMRPLPQSDALKSLYVFGVVDQHYLVMLENPVRSNAVTLDTEGKTYKVRWFNTRKGGELQIGTVEQVVSTDAQTQLGLPPSDIGHDWLAVLELVD